MPRTVTQAQSWAVVFGVLCLCLLLWMFNNALPKLWRKMQLVGGVHGVPCPSREELRPLCRDCVGLGRMKVGKSEQSRQIPLQNTLAKVRFVRVPDRSSWSTVPGNCWRSGWGYPSTRGTFSSLISHRADLRCHELCSERAAEQYQGWPWQPEGLVRVRSLLRSSCCAWRGSASQRSCSAGGSPVLCLLVLLSCCFSSLKGS